MARWLRQYKSYRLNDRHWGKLQGRSEKDLEQSYDKDLAWDAWCRGKMGMALLPENVSRKSTLWVMWAPEGAPQELDEGCASASGAQQCSTSYARSAVQVGPGTSGWFWLRRHLKISKVKFHAFLEGDHVAWAALEHLPFDLTPRPAGLSRRRFNLGPSP